LEDTVDIKVWFVCTLQQRREYSRSAYGAVVQLRNQYTLVTVNGVPSSELASGLPSATVIWQAEAIFLQLQEDLYLGYEIVTWETRYDDRNGVVLSRFQVLLPAEED